MASSSPQGLFVRQSAPPIHYIWVGAPAVTGIPGHDVAGPLTMAKQNTINPIYFWCLKAHVEAYQTKFKELPNIKVCAIEDLLTEAAAIPSLASPLEKIQFMLNQVTKKVEEEKKVDRDPIRDYVTLKVEISLLLHCIPKYRGYVFDTNIIPYEEKPLSLPIFAKFKVPCMPFVLSATMLDCWAMYCPPGEDKLGVELLINYTDKVDKLENAFMVNGNRKEYQEALGPAICDVLFEEKAKKRIEGWKTSTDEGGIFVLTAEPYFPVLAKCYFNTHKFTKTIAGLPEIFIQSQVNNLPWVRFFESYGVSIDQQLPATNKFGYQGETPLHFALKGDAIEVAQFLLEKGANPDLVAIYPQFKEPQSARMLIESIEVYAELLPFLKPRSPQPGI